MMLKEGLNTVEGIERFPVSETIYPRSGEDRQTPQSTTVRLCGVKHEVDEPTPHDTTHHHCRSLPRFEIYCSKHCFARLYVDSELCRCTVYLFQLQTVVASLCTFGVTCMHSLHLIAASTLLLQFARMFATSKCWCCTTPFLAASSLLAILK